MRIKIDTESSFELIICPYCGSRLNRVGKNNILPTSCDGCNKQRFEPKVMRVVDITKDLT